ncbi:MAG: hypothetical protein C4337_05005 [Armatimonadota bacterium]
MRAFRLVTPQQVQHVELPDPISQGDEALIRVHACGVCGTDLHLKNLGHGAWHGNPLTLGHEIVGRIIQLPARYTGPLHVGDAVVVDPQIVCRACYYCRRGRLNLCKHAHTRHRPRAQCRAPTPFGTDRRSWGTRGHRCRRLA